MKYDPGDWVMILPIVQFNYTPDVGRFEEVRELPWRVIGVQHHVRDRDGNIGDVLDIERDDANRPGHALRVTISAYGVEPDAAWLMTETMNGRRT